MANTYTLISSNVLTTSAATVTFSAIPSTYTDLVLKSSVRLQVDGSTTLYPFYFTLNSTGTTLFSETLIRANATFVQATSSTLEPGMYFNYGNAELSLANTFSSVEYYVPSYTASQKKPFYQRSASENNVVGAWQTMNADLYNSTNAVTSITLWNASTFTFVSGSSFYLYGIKNS